MSYKVCEGAECSFPQVQKLVAMPKILSEVVMAPDTLELLICQKLSHKLLADTWSITNLRCINR